MSSLKTHLGLGLVAMLAVPLGAQFEETPAVRADIGYESRQVVRGIERAGQSLQVEVELVREGFSGGVGVKQPFRSSETREASLHVAYAWRPTAGIKLESSVAHSWFKSVPGGGVKRSCEAGLAATFPGINGFTPTLAYRRDFRFRADTVNVALARSIPLTKLGAFLELEFFAGWARGDDWRPDAVGPRRRDGYGFWGGEVLLPYRVGAHSMVTAGLHFADSFERSPANGPFGVSMRSNLWFSLGVNLDF